MKIGKNLETNENVNIDLNKLVSTRMLINANSGAGKSWLGRRMMEQCANKVQQIIIDLEGEFVSLREKYDFLLVGKDGEIQTSVKSAELLALRLLELKTSAIIDLSELKKNERHLFVKKFLESLMESPSKLWHPLLVYVDESHQFAPEGKSGKAESKPSMIDLGTRGRKRGFCGVFMTQRISKLDKDLAAELNNQMIGRATLDIDRKRAAENLGFTTKDQERNLRNMPDGVFHAFGPAFDHNGIVKMKVGVIETTHPDRTKGIIIKPTKTPDNIKKVLKDVIDLPKEAETELKTKQEFQDRINELNKDLRILKNSKPKPEADEKALERARNQGYKEGLNQSIDEKNSLIKNYKQIERQLIDVGKILDRKIVFPKPEQIKQECVSEVRPKVHEVISEKKCDESPIDFSEEKEIVLGICAKKIYSVLYGNQDREFTKVQLGLISGYSARSSGFNNALCQMNVLKLIRRNNGKIIINELVEEHATEKRIEVSRDSWADNLGICSKKIFKFLLNHEYDEFPKEEIAENVGYSVRSSGFNNSLCQLNSLGLIQRINGNIKLHPEVAEL